MPRKGKRGATDSAGATPKRSKKTTSTFPIRIEAIHLEEETAVFHNTSEQPFDLKGYHVQDNEGRNSCRPFGDCILPPHSRVKFWTAPAGKKAPSDLQEDEKNIFWRNKDGKPRKHAVLDNDGDVLTLIDPEGKVVAEAEAKMVEKTMSHDVSGAAAADLSMPVSASTPVQSASPRAAAKSAPSSSSRKTKTTKKVKQASSSTTITTEKHQQHRKEILLKHVKSPDDLFEILKHNLKLIQKDVYTTNVSALA